MLVRAQKVILLGLTLDNCLTFKNHIDTKRIYNAFINGKFSYASIIWMFCRNKDYLKMENLQYKALKGTLMQI